MRSPEYVQKMCTNSHTASSRIKELSSIRRQLTVILESQHELQTSLEHVGGTWHCTKDKTYYGFIFRLFLNKINFTWIFTVDDVTVLWCHQQQCFLVGEAVKPKSSHSASRSQFPTPPPFSPPRQNTFVVHRTKATSQHSWKGALASPVGRWRWDTAKESLGACRFVDCCCFEQLMFITFMFTMWRYSPLQQHQQPYARICGNQCQPWLRDPAGNACKCLQ